MWTSFMYQNHQHLLWGCWFQWRPQERGACPGASISPGSLGELQINGLMEMATEDNDLGSSGFSSPFLPLTSGESLNT